ncbi:MAG: 16S rRNA (cytosine(967)-C(5))-methyltransferase RsmB [Ruminococcaceae bacterium]|nr:16S rRNA (cytosine(967)-C(5))-methyltransferase RsmB [Oscillospiraceae bacterium]
MTARESALRALHSIDTQSAYVNAALKQALSVDGMSLADKGLVTEIIYGVVSNKTAVDYIISQFSKVKLKKMSPWVLAILRMGVFQIFYMDKIPHSAACNEAVKLAKKYSHGAGAGFVNGVLRSVARSIEEFSFPKTGDAVKDLSLEYSYPEWMTKKLITEYGAEKCAELYAENRKAHGICVRVNTLKTTPAKLIDILKAEGVECEKVENAENALYLHGKFNAELSAAYRDGLFSLQNISSQMAVEALDPQKNELIIDMCAAPGGKSCAAAERMGNEGKVISFDIFEHKINLIKNAAKRLGISIIDAKVGDSTAICEELAGKADRVLADVPCSGLGVIHKKPDIKWSRKELDIAELCNIQAKILEVAAAYVKDGGVLVYSTCTILPEENRLRIEEFLKNHSEFKKVFEQQILTGYSGESGFYICKMVKEL